MIFSCQCVLCINQYEDIWPKYLSQQTDKIESCRSVVIKIFWSDMFILIYAEQNFSEFLKTIVLFIYMFQ